MKTRDMMTLFVSFFMIIQLSYVHAQDIDNEAKQLQEMFQKMFDKAELVEWKGTQTCKPERLIELAKKDNKILPLPRGKKFGVPDLFDVISKLVNYDVYVPKKDIGKKIPVADEDITKDGCNYIIRSNFAIVEANNEKLRCKITTTVRVRCNCDEPSDENDVKSGAFYYEAYILGNLRTKNL